MKATIMAALLAAGLVPGAVLAMDGHMPRGTGAMWLDPMSMDEIRAQRAKRQSAEKAGGKPQADRAGGERKKGAARYMRRVYHLRSGAFPRPAGGHMGAGDVPASAVLWVTAPDRSVERFEPTRRGPSVMASFPAGDGGWYRLYAYADLGIRDGMRVHLTSHAAVFSHGEHPDEKTPPTVEGPGYVDGRPVVELERVCESHNECYRATTGQTLRVRARFEGKPLADAPVSLTTEQGWRVTGRTDAKGEASFTLIKESFPDEPDRRNAEDYVLKLEHTVEGMGSLNGEHYHGERYVATLPLKVYPSAWDWESRSVGFQVLAGTILVTGGAVAVRRRRRRTPA